jgi:hypothetical protein
MQPAVRFAPRLLAGDGTLQLSIVGGKELVGISFPPEQNEYGHCILLPGLLGCVRPLTLIHHSTLWDLSECDASTESLCTRVPRETVWKVG